MASISAANIAAFSESERPHRAGGSTNHLHDIGVIPVDHRQSSSGDKVEESPEGQLDLVQGVKNIRMIELDVIDDGQLGQVMQELRALIEESRIVFVAFQDIELGIGKACPSP